MAQQNINLGTGVDNNEGNPDRVFEAMPKIQSNFNELYEISLQSSGGAITEIPISLTGIDEDLTELEKIALAINQRPNYTIPLGHLHVVSYYRPFTEGELSEFFYKDYYAVKTGSGSYGLFGSTNGVEVSSSNIIKLGSIVSEPDGLTPFADIGTTPIADYINLNVPSIDFAGFSIVSATIGGEFIQYVFNGEEGNYGSGSGQLTTAENFIELTDLSISDIFQDVVSTNVSQPSGTSIIRNIVRISQEDYNAAEASSELRDDTHYIITNNTTISDILINGNPFTYKKHPLNNTGNILEGDLALNGWINNSRFGKILSYVSGDPLISNSWREIESI